MNRTTMTIADARAHRRDKQRAKRTPGAIAAALDQINLALRMAAAGRPGLAVTHLAQAKNELEDVRACRVCGCTGSVACIPPCWWVETDLCSHCAAGAETTGAGPTG